MVMVNIKIGKVIVIEVNGITIIKMARVNSGMLMEIIMKENG